MTLDIGSLGFDLQNIELNILKGAQEVQHFLGTDTPLTLQNVNTRLSPIPLGTEIAPITDVATTAETQVQTSIGKTIASTGLTNTAVGLEQDLQFLVHPQTLSQLLTRYAILGSFGAVVGHEVINYLFPSQTSTVSTQYTTTYRPSTRHYRRRDRD